MLEPAEFGEGRTPAQTRMAGPADQHVLLGKHEPPVQSPDRLVPDMKCQIYPALFKLPAHVGGRDLKNRQPGTGRSGTQTGQRRQQDG